MIDEFDVLLIPESEYGNYTFSDTVKAAWASILPDFVNEGGIVVCLNGGPNLANLASSARMINGTLLQITNPEIASSNQMDVSDSDDALARNVATFFGPSATVSFDVPEGTKVVEDNTDAKAVVVHKTMGSGHVVLLGFDMFATETNVDHLLKNSILLHRHVVVDNSHGQVFNIASGFDEMANDLPYFGFSVSSMNTFDPEILASCEILVVSICTTVYNTTEVQIIHDFVSAGGGLFVVTDIVQFGNELDPLINEFGFERNTTHMLEDADEYASTNTYWPRYALPDNLEVHSTTVGVDVVEFYGPTGFIEMPQSAVPLIVTDTDGTSSWGGLENAPGVPLAAADLVGAGRVIVLCDSGPMDTSDYDSDGLSGYMDSDNELFIRNSFRWLAGAGIPEQTVVVDESHNPYRFIHYEHNPLANFLMFNGYNVVTMRSFDSATFNDAEILLIFGGWSSYNTSEIGMIVDYVSNGGGLVLWGDNQIFCTELDPIGQEFGLFVNTTGALEDSDDFVTSIYPNNFSIYWDGANIGTHPIMDGVDRVETDISTAFISIGSGTALISTDSDGTTTWEGGTPAIDIPVFAATSYNLGRVVFMTDYELAAASDTESDGFPLLYDSDNPIFVANIFKWLAENRAASVEVVSPNGGEVLSGTVTVSWTAADPNQDVLTFDVFYSDDDGSSWNEVVLGTTETTSQWDTSLVDDGTDYLIRVVASDGELDSEDVSDGTFTVDNSVSTTTPTTPTTNTGPGDGGTTTILIIIIAAGSGVIIIIIIIITKRKGG
jgi:hypothetical protein